ncbi:MAG: serine hydrolase [Ignavibacteria bacterium]|nr:serine hydrolase [Ignavibacteria bacterium]
MNAILAKYNVVGGQMAITYQGRLVYNRGYGITDTLDKRKVQPNSIFRLASVSKAITSIAVMKLFEAGTIDLDRTVLGSSGILNDTIYQNALDPRMYKFTVRQLLNHSAGFTFNFTTEPLWKTYEIALATGENPPTNSFENVLKWTLKHDTLGFSPGTSVFYSNFGYTLLGLVIERVTGKKYEDYVRDSILTPLGIVDMHEGRTLQHDKYPNEVSYYTYPGAPLSTSIFTGIPKSVPAQYGGYNWEIMTPAGGWVASAQDLCKLLTAVDGISNRQDILTSATQDTMTQKSKNWPEYGLGWFVNADEKYHTGGIEGTATIIRTNKKHQTSYAILFNTLPEVYTPFYLEFMSMVSDEFPNIPTWPTLDLFDNVNVLNDFQDNSTITIYSNHQDSKLSIDNFPSSFQGTLTVYSVIGQKLLQKEITGARSSISVDMLPTGMYLLVIENKDRTVMTRTVFIH